MDRSRRQHVLELKIPPVVLGASTAIVMWIASSSTPFLVFVIPARSLCAAVLILTGAIVSGLGVASFRRAGTTVNPMKQRILPPRAGGFRALAKTILLALALVAIGQVLVWRLRIPFDEFDSPRNSLSKLQRYPKVYDNINSFSHRDDFVRACLDLWGRRAPFGIYNVTNPGAISTRRIIGLIERILKPARPFEFFSDNAESYQSGVKAPRSNCILETTKLLAAGVRMRPVEEAMEHALQDWKPIA